MKTLTTKLLFFVLIIYCSCNNDEQNNDIPLEIDVDLEFIYNELLKDDLLNNLTFNEFLNNINNSDNIVDLQKNSIYNSNIDKTTVTISLTTLNGASLSNISIVSYIPKSMANHVSQIDFSTQPTFIVNEDPIIMWHLQGVEDHPPTISISFSFSGNLINSGITHDSVYVVTNNDLANNSSDDVIFNPNLKYGSVIDASFNTYKTIEIGSQIWMAENLRTTRYDNGDEIPEGPSNFQWNTLTMGAYRNYNDDSANVNPYGRLYNWYAVNDSRNLCPFGWRIPTEEDWFILANYIGGNKVGGSLKEIGTEHWNSPNEGATNNSGFTALPSGLISYYNGASISLGENGYWWTSTSYSSNQARYRSLDYNSQYLFGSSNVKFKTYGMCIRCIKN